ncbi:Hypothetical protein PFR_JS17-2_2070 [Propionibacterium freudenreichii]|nr:Hypothetical protein PFR_JS17-1_2071 [Propionibacterium freudenreichii]SCQ81346.1 Hypothetical protein PFR_JS17-2_2070 [Propionibacterium freudenreichii]
MIETSHAVVGHGTDIAKQVLRCDRCNKALGWLHVSSAPETADDLTKAARWLRRQASTLGWRTDPNAKRDICPQCTKALAA